VHGLDLLKNRARRLWPRPINGGCTPVNGSERRRPSSVLLSVNLDRIAKQTVYFPVFEEAAVNDAKARYAKLAADLASPPPAPRQTVAE